MIILHILLFFTIAFAENFLISLNSKFRQHSHEMPTFITAYINILVWYYIFKSVQEGILSKLVLYFYAGGYALGDVLAIKFANYLQRLTKKRGFKRKIKRLYRMFKR